MVLRGFWRRSAVTVIAIAGFVALYEVTILDSKGE